MTSTRNHSLLLEAAAVLWASSLLPTAHAFCYIDGFGIERCTLSTGARIGIAIGLLALAGLFAALAMMAYRKRRARMQQSNLAYAQNANFNNHYPGPQGYYSPGGPPQYPQYPPQAYAHYPGGYDPTTGFAPPMGAPPQYAPPPMAPPEGKQ